MKDNNDRKSTLIAFSIVSFIIFFNLYCNIKGNPFKFYEFKRDAEKYIAETYPENDFYVESMEFDSREGDYTINIKSKTRSARNFKVTINEKSSFYEEIEYEDLPEPS